MRVRRETWAVLGLVAVLAFEVWWRCHTVGPTLRGRLGVDLYPVTGAEAEPLDCDEAVYAFIGKRLTRGAVMYRDVTENKPPLGYWLFALAVSVGGCDEFTVRLMPLPFVLGTTALVWWLGIRLRGPAAAVLAALSFAILSADPFVYGNGDPMEHMMNLFSVASLALVVRGWDRTDRVGLIAAGVCLGAAALVKQVAALHGAVFAVALGLRWTRTNANRLKDISALAGGLLAACGVAALILVSQGGGREAFEDIFRYGPALATDVPADPHAPPLLVRWFTGNADPGGHLPPPFGRTDYLVWWGSGSWPVWVAGVPSLVWLAAGPGSSAGRRIVAAWTLSAWVQVALPRLFWAHYYLLPVPGLSVVVAVFLADLVTLRPWRVRSAVAALTVAAALAWTARIQVSEYLLVPPQALTVRHKGGRQWVALRALGRELKNRSGAWTRPTLFVWGWQSPLYVYSGLDGPTRQVFADDLVKTFAGSNHPRVRPRIDRTMRELNERPPSLIFCGYPPFPALRAFLDARYFPSRLTMSSPDGRGLWVERGKFGEFENGPRE